MSFNHNHPHDAVQAQAVAAIIEPTRYRIMCRRADGIIGLVRLCGTITLAQKYARALVDKQLLKLRTQRAVVLADARRPREVTIEKWIGTATEGSWELLDRREGYYFEFLDHAPRFGNRHVPVDGAPTAAQAPASSAPMRKKPAELAVVATTNREPRNGDIVACVLLERRTRKGGRFAKLIGWPASGPICGEPKEELPAGQTVQLKLSGIKLATGFAQLAWPAVDSRVGVLAKAVRQVGALHRQVSPRMVRRESLAECPY